MLTKLKRNLILSIIVSIVIYLGLSIFANFNLVIKSFTDIPLILLPILLLLSYLNYLTRFIKWHYYLKILKINLSLKKSFMIFMSGLSMSVTPGKMGELLKCYFIKKECEIPINKTAPIIFAERATDFISLIFLAIFGAFVFNYGKDLIIISGIFFIIIVSVISYKKLSLKILSILNIIPMLKKYSISIINAYESAYILFRPKALMNSLFISLFSWFFECFGFYLILVNFRETISIFWSTFVYSFATIFGSVTMLPGGLGATEGSLTFLLINSNFTNETAVASTFIVRVVTLWFAVLVGLMALYIYKKHTGIINLDTME